jgi:hypothetical protein
MPTSNLSQAIIAWLQEHGPCTMRQILAGVGKYISANRASNACRRRDAYDARRGQPRRERTVQQAIEAGRQQLLWEYSYELLSKGRIAKLKKGIYGPLPPKLKIHRPKTA